MKIKVNLMKLFMFLSIFVFMFYTMFYQHMVGEVAGILNILYIIMLVLNVVSIIRDVSRIKNFEWMLLFVIVSFVSGMFFSINDGREQFIESIMRIISYLVVMYCIYSYIGNDKKNLTLVMLALWTSALALTISTFFIGVETTYYGGISIGELNKNMLSCYITIGFFAGIYLVYETKKIWKKVLLFSSMSLEILAQLNAASRVGVASILILLFAYIHSVYTIKDKKKRTSRVVWIVALSIGLVCFMLSFSRLSELFIIFERFRGNYAVGDSLRKYLHLIARDFFFSSPIFGRGFGCVSVTCGTYSHSFYYELLASVGLVGFVILIIPMIKYMIGFYRISCLQTECVENRLLARLMGWSVLLVLITGIGQVYIYYFFFYIYITIWISTFEIIKKQPGKEAKDKLAELLT